MTKHQTNDFFDSNFCYGTPKDIKKRIKKMLHDGFSIDTVVDDYGKTLLIEAVSQKKNTEIIEFIIKNKANVNAQDINGWTALHWAVSLSDYETAKLLIENGADLNAKTKVNDTPLHISAWNSGVKIPALLIKNGANINPGKGQFGTPIETACSCQQYKVAEFLVNISLNLLIFINSCLSAYPRKNTNQSDDVDSTKKYFAEQLAHMKSEKERLRKITSQKRIPVDIYFRQKDE